MCLMVYTKAKPKSCVNNQRQKEMEMSKQKNDAYITDKEVKQNRILTNTT